MSFSTMKPKLLRSPAGAGLPDQTGIASRIAVGFTGRLGADQCEDRRSQQKAEKHFALAEPFVQKRRRSSAAMAGLIIEAVSPAAVDRHRVLPAQDQA